MFQKKIFENDRDREHFAELLALMVERYCVVLHATVRMDNQLGEQAESVSGSDLVGIGVRP